MTHSFCPLSDEEAANVTANMFAYRDEVRRLLGTEYQGKIQPVMDALQATARAEGISVMRAFELVATGPVERGDGLTVIVWMSALVELYELADRTMRRMEG